MIPQFGKVKTDRCRIVMLAFQDGVGEPAQPSFQGGIDQLSLAVKSYQRFHCKRRFFHTPVGLIWQVGPRSSQSQ